MPSAIGSKTHSIRESIASLALSSRMALAFSCLGFGSRNGIPSLVGYCPGGLCNQRQNQCFSSTPMGTGTGRAGGTQYRGVVGRAVIEGGQGKQHREAAVEIQNLKVLSVISILFPPLPASSHRQTLFLAISSSTWSQLSDNKN